MLETEHPSGAQQVSPRKLHAPVNITGTSSPRHRGYCLLQTAQGVSGGVSRWQSLVAAKGARLGLSGCACQLLSIVVREQRQAVCQRKRFGWAQGARGSLGKRRPHGSASGRGSAAFQEELPPGPSSRQHGRVPRPPSCSIWSLCLLLSRSFWSNPGPQHGVPGEQD